MNETDIRDFWQAHPCGEGLIPESFEADIGRFFESYDAMRYSKERHILDCLKAIDFKGKSVLEIGLGQGADAEQIARAGAHYNGLDLTAEAVNRVKTRFALRKLPHGDVKQGSALDIPFADNSFDIVFSHGVLHHIPDIEKTQSEIARVLKPGGELIIMLYARNSLNYRFAISVVRRLALIPFYVTGIKPSKMVAEHVENAKRVGLFNYLRMENFIHRNTDGPGNPFSRVYDVSRIEKDFPDFKVKKSYKRFMYAPPLPITWLPFERQLGWHLWAHLAPNKS
jgi:ubiquinone/menaquinone biosynthesis C-methylase UbiE